MLKSKHVAALFTAGALVLTSTACSGGKSASSGAGSSPDVIRTPIVAELAPWTQMSTTNPTVC